MNPHQADENRAYDAALRRFLGSLTVEHFFQKAQRRAKISGNEFEAGITRIEIPQFPLEIFKVQPVIPALIPISSIALPYSPLILGLHEAAKAIAQSENFASAPFDGVSERINLIPNPAAPLIKGIKPKRAKLAVAGFASPRRWSIRFKPFFLIRALKPNRDDVIPAGWRITAVSASATVPESKDREHWQDCFVHAEADGVLPTPPGGICWNRNVSRGGGQRSCPGKRGRFWFHTALLRFVGSSLFQFTRIPNDSLTHSAMVYPLSQSGQGRIERRARIRAFWYGVALGFLAGITTLISVIVGMFAL